MELKKFSAYCLKQHYERVRAIEHDGRTWNAYRNRHGLFKSVVLTADDPAEAVNGYVEAIHMSKNFRGYKLEGLRLDDTELIKKILEVL